MMQGDTEERRHDYTAFAALMTETLGSLKARDGDTALNTERLKTLVDITHDIKEQLTLMNGRVRQNERDLVAITASSPMTRDYCDERRGELDKAIRELQQRTPAIIQVIAVSLITGGMMAVVSTLLNRVP